MKVNDPNGTGIPGLSKNEKTDRINERRTVKGASNESDQCQLSTLSSVLGALQTESPQRAARLDHLSVAVGTGRYGIDPYVVGASVIRESLSAGYR